MTGWRWRVSASKLHLSCCWKPTGLPHCVAAWLHKCRPIGRDLLCIAYLLDLCQHVFFTAVRVSRVVVPYLPCLAYCFLPSSEGEHRASDCSGPTCFSILRQPSWSPAAASCLGSLEVGFAFLRCCFFCWSFQVNGMQYAMLCRRLHNALIWR